jgi:hypothetical protein
MEIIQESEDIVRNPITVSPFLHSIIPAITSNTPINRHLGRKHHGLFDASIEWKHLQNEIDWCRETYLALNMIREKGSEAWTDSAERMLAMALLPFIRISKTIERDPQIYKNSMTILNQCVQLMRADSPSRKAVEEQIQT